MKSEANEILEAYFMKTKAKISLSQTLEKICYHLNVLLGPPKAWEDAMQTITLMLKLPKWQGKCVSTSAAHQIASPLPLLFRFSGIRDLWEDL